MTTLMELAVVLTLAAEGYKRGLEEAERISERAGGGIVGSLAQIGGGIVTGALAIGAGAVKEFGDFLGDSVEKAMEAQNAQAQLAQVIKSTGGAAGITAMHANNLANTFSGLTKYSADTIIGGENMLLTFTNIGSKTFPDATKAILDLSTAMGTDLKSSAIQVGKALNDPEKGITALTRVGVTFSEEQKKLIKHLQDTGNMAGAQRVILDELNKEFGGSAIAAGQTAAGGIAIFNHQIEETQEKIGGALLPIISKLASQVVEWISSPAVQTGIQNFTNGIADLAQKAVSMIPQVIIWFQQIGDWFSNNQGVIVGILAAMGVAVAVFVYTTVVPAAISLITALAPVILVMAIIAGVAYLVYQAWTNNWGGIREKVAAVWAWLQPIFEQIKAWLAVNIPIAIQTLKTFWETVLLPAIQKVWQWVQDVVFPIIIKLIDWLKTNIPLALQTLSDFWTNTLLPAIKDVWAWIEANLLPIFDSLGKLLGTTLALVLTALAGLWQNVLLPALKDVWKWLQDNLLPIFKIVGDWISEHFTPAVNGIAEAFKGVKTWIDNAIETLKNIKLPDWLTPGSPTPFEMGLRGIGNALSNLSNSSLPEFSVKVGALSSPFGMAGVGGQSSGSAVNNYNLTINGGTTPENVAADFMMLRSLVSPGV